MLALGASQSLPIFVGLLSRSTLFTSGYLPNSQFNLSVVYMLKTTLTICLINTSAFIV